MMSPEEWDVARRVCTEKQLRALDLWRRGWGARRVAHHLGIDVSSARARIAAGRRRIYDECVRLAEAEEALS